MKPVPKINQISILSFTFEIRIPAAANIAESVHRDTAAFLRDKPALINR